MPTPPDVGRSAENSYMYSINYLYLYVRVRQMQKTRMLELTHRNHGCAGGSDER